VRPGWATRRPADLVDDRPRLVRRAQLVRLAAHRQRGEARQGGRWRGPAVQRRGIEDGVAGHQQQERLGQLGLGAGAWAQAEQRGQGRVVGRRQLDRAPALQRGREGDRGDRMAEVVLAVAKRSLAVLPRLAPGDRAEAEQQARRRQAAAQRGPGVGIDGGAALERVQQRTVVIEAWPRGQAVDRRREQVGLGRVQVAARWIDAQRPARCALLLPRRQREAVKQQGVDPRHAERRGRDGARTKQVAPARPARQAAARQGQRLGAGIHTKRIGLAVPVEISERGRVPTRPMLAALVVRQHQFVVVGHARTLTAALRVRQRAGPRAGAATRSAAARRRSRRTRLPNEREALIGWRCAQYGSHGGLTHWQSPGLADGSTAAGPRRRLRVEPGGRPARG
jgi:hypothetical protein